MSTPSELDIRRAVPKEKHPLVFSTFDGLVEGETFQLINDHDPVPLYFQLETERKYQFEWEYIERGPNVWRVNITRIA